MKQYDYYTGEPTEIGSPQNMFQSGTNMGTQYSFDPNQRMQQMYSNPAMNYNAFQQGFQNPPNNFMNPPQQNPYQHQGFQGYYGSPAMQFFPQQQNVYNPYMQHYQQPQYHDQIVHVPGFHTGSQAMFTSNIEEICDKMQIDMMMEQEEAIAKRNQRVQGYFNNNGYNNYYGMPYMNNYMDSAVSMKYQRKVDELRQEAVERRMNFNKNLFRLCNNYLDQGVSEEEINRIYEGYTYTIPAAIQQVEYETNRLSNLVPISNQHIYAQHFNEIQKFYDTVCPKKDLQGFLESHGALHNYEMMEEEQHRRRDASRYYQEDGYKRILRKSIARRNGIDVEQTQQPQVPNIINNFPTLSQSGKMMEDGTISISAPPWLGSTKHIQITNELEQHFEENRNKFLQSIYAQNSNEELPFK